MNTTKITKFSTALAIICAVTCGIAIAPLIILAIFALVGLLCLLICLLIYLLGGILWLITLSGVDIFPVATAISDFAKSLFDYIGPIAQFSCFYITPYAGYAAIAAGVLGIIVSAVALARARHETEQEPDTSAESSVGASSSGGIFNPYSVYNAEGKAVPEKKEKGKKNKKPRAKKAKTLKGACIASLVVCIVFTVVAVAAIIFAYNCEGMFINM